MKTAAQFHQLLREQLVKVESQAGHLRYSCGSLEDPQWLQRLGEERVLERFEALAARFARLQDMVAGPFRLIALLTYEEESAKPDRFMDLLNLMERYTILQYARQWQEFRAIRNAIAHDYMDDLERLGQLYQRVLLKSVELLEIVERLNDYVNSNLSVSGEVQ